MNPLNLNIDLSKVDTSMPLLAPGNYHVIIQDAKVDENKAGTGHNLVATYATVDAETTSSGDLLRAGFRLRKWYPLQGSEKDQTLYLQRLAVLFDAAFKITDPSERKPITPELIASLIGCEVIITVKIEKDQNGAEQNNVTMVKAC